MNPQVVFSESGQEVELPEVQRLMQHIQKTAIASDNLPIQLQEVAAVGNRIIHTLVWQYPYLDQVIQESLDDLRFKAEVK